jgi:hypothetical protein
VRVFGRAEFDPALAQEYESQVFGPLEERVIARS